MQGIHPMLWFDGKAEEAANFYVSIFPDSRVVEIMRYPEGTPPQAGQVGEVAVVGFELRGQRFSALNGGPAFQFNEAVSFVIDCDTQAEIDRYWDALRADGGKESVCGWLKDKYGISWQVTPTMIYELYSGDKKKASAAFKAMLGMVKLDIAELKRAYDEA
jgi:predicted 3-demethylubiquinone-9 3-methyltransferase (glyoxalase superfamily)